MNVWLRRVDVPTPVSTLPVAIPAPVPPATHSTWARTSMGLVIGLINLISTVHVRVSIPDN